jgi:hypothetical protein
MLIFIEEAINLDGQGEKTVLSWLRSATMSEVMITLAKEVSNMLSSSEKQKSLSWLILKLCFSPSTQWENGTVVFLLFNNRIFIKYKYLKKFQISKFNWASAQKMNIN